MADDLSEKTYRDRAIADADRQVVNLQARFEDYTQNVPAGKAYEYEILASVTLARLQRAKEHRAALEELFLDLHDRRPPDWSAQAVRPQQQFDAQILDTRAQARPPAAEAPDEEPAPDIVVDDVRERVEVRRDHPFIRRARWTYRHRPRQVVAGAVVAGFVVVLLNRGTSDTADSGPTVASFAGHYEFVRGFDDPSGADVYPTAPGVYDNIIPGPASGGFDVDNEGRITTGAVRISKTATGRGETCSYAFEATSVSGSIELTEPGASGEISWPGTLTFGGDCSTRSRESISTRFLVGIVGDTVVLCGSEIQSSLDACGGAQSRVVAVFDKAD